MINIKAIQNKFNEHREKALVDLVVKEDRFFSIYDPNKVKSEKVKEREKDLLRAVGSLHAVYGALASFCAEKHLQLSELLNFKEMSYVPLKWLTEKQYLEVGEEEDHHYFLYNKLELLEHLRRSSKLH